MNLESLILNVCELRNAYDKKFAVVSQQKSDDFSQTLRRLRDIEMISGAIYALDQVIALTEGDALRRKNATAQNKQAKDINALTNGVLLTNGMTLSKEDVAYLHARPCFSCKWSAIDPYDWGLRCCNSDSEHCTEYTPDKSCELFERRYWNEL